MDSAAQGIVDRLIALGIAGAGPFDSAAEVADAALRSAGGDPAKAVDSIVTTHNRLVAAQGFATGLGGFVTLPVALPANVIGFFAIATRAIAAIAKLRGYDISKPQVRTAVMMTLMGSDAKGLMAKAGVASVSGRIADLASQGMPAPAVMILNKGVGFHLLSQVGRQGVGRVLGRGVPLIGGVVGAGADYWLLRDMMKQAREEFPATTEADFAASAEFSPKDDEEKA